MPYNVLLLGGTGSLGQLLTDRFLKEKYVFSIRLYARNEHDMWLAMKKYEGESRLRFLIGDVRDKERLDKAFTDIAVCVNCAAMKHVALCETNPFEAVNTNVIGVQNAIECAIKRNIKMFVQISTDKAVEPINIYGKTKALAENLVLDAINHQGKATTKFVVVRSGNIKASKGSCYELWDSQFEKNQRLTITDLEASRYMADGDKIADKIVDIVVRNRKSGLYVLSMPQVKVIDMIEKYGKGYPLDIIGLQKGEKMEEKLYTDGESFVEIEVN